MTWNPRDTRRWGDQRTVTQLPTLGAITFLSPELARAEGPSPATWNAGVLAANIAAVDVAGMVWSVLLSIGLGAAQFEMALPFTPGTPASIVLLPAQWLTLRVQAVGAVAVGGNWQFTGWAAPTIPFDGVSVGVEAEVEFNG